MSKKDGKRPKFGAPGTRGQVVEGTVTEIQDCSIFLDLGDGATGLVHCSDLSWARFDHPTDIVTLAQRLRVKVLYNPPNSPVMTLAGEPKVWEAGQ